MITSDDRSCRNLSSVSTLPNELEDAVFLLSERPSLDQGTSFRTRSGTSIDPFSGSPSYFAKRTNQMFFNISSGRLAPLAGIALTTQVDRQPLHIQHVQAHPTIASGSSRQATALTVLQPDVPFSPVICANARKNVNERPSSPAPPCPSPQEPSPPTAT